MHPPKRILVVDDNTLNHRILEEMLSEDYRLAFATDGFAALELAERFQPAILLLDVMMPGMDGIETCRRIRQLAGFSDTLVIMVSAKAMPSEQAEGFEAGADHYITKPFDETELSEILRQYDDPPNGNTQSSSPDGCRRNGRLCSKYRQKPKVHE